MSRQKTEFSSLDVGPGYSPARGTTHAVDVPENIEFTSTEDPLGRFTPRIRKEARKDRQKGIYFRYGDVTKKLPFRTNKFDRVTSNYVLEVYPRAREALPEMMRVLKSGGHFSFKVYSGDEQIVLDELRSYDVTITDKRVIEHDEDGLPMTTVIRGYKR